MILGGLPNANRCRSNVVAIEPIGDGPDLPRLLDQTAVSGIAADSAGKQRAAILALAERLVQSDQSVLADYSLAVLQSDMPTRQATGAALAGHFEEAVGTVGRRHRGAVYTPSAVVWFIIREGLTARVAAEFKVSMEEGRSYLVPDVARGLPTKVQARLGSLLRDLRIVDPRRELAHFSSALPWSSRPSPASCGGRASGSRPARHGTRRSAPLPRLRNRR